LITNFWIWNSVGRIDGRQQGNQGMARGKPFSLYHFSFAIGSLGFGDRPLVELPRKLNLQGLLIPCPRRLKNEK
jgi:hypothetical protein